MPKLPKANRYERLVENLAKELFCNPRPNALKTIKHDLLVEIEKICVTKEQVAQIAGMTRPAIRTILYGTTSDKSAEHDAE